MNYVNLGRSGLKVSRLCLGCMGFGRRSWREWVLDEDECRPIIRRAFEQGINFVDTADMYSLGTSEEVVGRAIRDFASRDQIVLATKAFWPMGSGPNDRGLSRKHLLEAIDASLRRLGTDYVDLFQIHRFDPGTPLEETLRALEDIVRCGKARYLGSSSCYAWQLAQALALADRRGWTRFVSMQNHYNMVYREEEREMIPLCRAEDVAIIPWSPFARGLLAGNRHRKEIGTTTRARSDDFGLQLYDDENDFEIAARCAEIAQRRQLPPAQIALAWLLHKPGVTAPIVGSTKVAHIDEAVAALDVRLEEGEMQFLEESYRPHPVRGI